MHELIESFGKKRKDPQGNVSDLDRLFNGGWGKEERIKNCQRLHLSNPN